jgi:hypothetical protein
MLTGDAAMDNPRRNVANARSWKRILLHETWQTKLQATRRAVKVLHEAARQHTAWIPSPPREGERE